MQNTAKVINFPARAQFDISSPNRVPNHSEHYNLLHDTRLSPGAYKLYIILVWYRNEQDIAFPSKKKIMEIAGWGNLATLNGHLQTLIKLGYIRLETRAYFHQGRKAKEFRYYFPKLPTFRSGFIELLPEHRSEKISLGEDLKKDLKREQSNSKTPYPQNFPQIAKLEEEKPEEKIAVSILTIQKPEPTPITAPTPIADFQETWQSADETFLDDQIETPEQPESLVIAFQEDLQKPLPVLKQEIIEQTKILEQTHPGDQPSPYLVTQPLKQSHPESVKILVKVFGHLQILAALKIANLQKTPIKNPGGWMRRSLQEGWLGRYVSWYEHIKQAELDYQKSFSINREKARLEEEKNRQIKDERARLDARIAGLSMADHDALREHAIQRLKAKQIPEILLKNFLRSEMRVILVERVE